MTDLGSDPHEAYAAHQPVTVYPRVSYDKHTMLTKPVTKLVYDADIL